MDWGETKAYNAFTKVGYAISETQRLDLMYNYFSSNQDSKFLRQPGVYGNKPAIGVRGERLGVDEGTRYNHNANLQYTNKQLFGKTRLAANIFRIFTQLFRTPHFLWRRTIGHFYL